jgi:hypothetical protein
MKRSLKRRLLRSRIALNQTIHTILNINKKRKNLQFQEDTRQEQDKLNEELKLLNKLAVHQQLLIKKYERELSLNLEPATERPFQGE